ncbi:hypothetical protein EYF80_011178 [Liparis tanakae]|uniref:Uncharacterized protein n=1 Tax=Liparis tanakae TaxID=230148 RepID=A0A4Z2IN51_9TELE|nr:hypothetical protein EYF80_011178 [Liparis tanakae]
MPPNTTHCGFKPPSLATAQLLTNHLSIIQIPVFVRHPSPDAVMEDLHSARAIRATAQLLTNHLSIIQIPVVVRHPSPDAVMEDLHSARAMHGRGSILASVHTYDILQVTCHLTGHLSTVIDEKRQKKLWVCYSYWV